MRISVFLSRSSPFNDMQKEFLRKFQEKLRDFDLEPRILGETDYDVTAPLAGCRRLMMECNGLVTIAFRRNKIIQATSRPGFDDDLNGKWLTSEFCQIEPSMAYQLGLPVLIFREHGVLEQGILEKGTLGVYLPEFDLENEDMDSYFESVQFRDLLFKWTFQVRTVWDRKGKIDLY